jgi:hypothetical protein
VPELEPTSQPESKPEKFSFPERGLDFIEAGHYGAFCHLGSNNWIPLVDWTRLKIKSEKELFKG